MFQSTIRALGTMTVLAVLLVAVVAGTADAGQRGKGAATATPVVKTQPAVVDQPAQSINRQAEITARLEQELTVQPDAGEAIDWSVFSSGGTTSTSGVYAVECAIGQFAAGYISGGTTEVSQGFLQNFNTGCCIGVRGNIDMVGIVDLPDLSYLIDYLTPPSGPALPCLDEANIDGLGIVNLTDLSYLIDYLTPPAGPALPNCP